MYVVVFPPQMVLSLPKGGSLALSPSDGFLKKLPLASSPPSLFFQLSLFSLVGRYDIPECAFW